MPKPKFEGKIKIIIPSREQQEASKPDVAELLEEHKLDSRGTLRVGAHQSIVVEADKLIEKRELGRGQYGSVHEMVHEESNTVMAVKRIRLTDDTRERHTLWMDHDTAMRSLDCPYTIHFYGALFREGDVWICMERMDSSLHDLYTKLGKKDLRVPEEVIGKMNFCVIMALDYLKETLGIIHRDVKPSNVLINRAGEIKLCDFGISGRLVDSVAKTKDVGCRPYMAPERISHNPVAGESETYDIRSDVWSLGISLVEIATGKFPLAYTGGSLFQLLRLVVEGPPPQLPDSGDFTPEFRDYTIHCLKKNQADRPKYKMLMDHAFFRIYKESKFSVADWYSSCAEHLV